MKNIMEQLEKVLVFVCILILFLTATVSIEGTVNENDIVLPKYSTEIAGKFYFLDKPSGNIFMLSDGSKTATKLTDTSINEAGILSFKGHIFFVDNHTAKLCMMEADGSRIDEIDTCKLEMPYKPMFVIGDKLYYYNSDHTIVEMNADGKRMNVDKEKNAYLYNISMNSLLCNGELFFWDDDGIYMMHTQGKEAIRISTQKIYGSLYADKQSLYYIDSVDLKPYRMDITGEHKVLLADAAVIECGADFDAGNMQVDKNGVLFTENQTLYKLDEKKDRKLKLMDHVAYFILQEDKVYYIDSFDAGTLYELNLENGDNRKICSSDFIPFIDAANGYIFFGTKSGNDDKAGQGEVKFQKI